MPLPALQKDTKIIVPCKYYVKSIIDGGIVSIAIVFYQTLLFSNSHFAYILHMQNKEPPCRVCYSKN